MRSIRRSAVLAALVFACQAPIAGADAADEGSSHTSNSVVRNERSLEVRVLPRDSFRLSEDDEIATLDAIRVALTEVADGNSYVWYRHHGHLNGLIRPTSSFKDAGGRVCRHIVVMLSAGPRTGNVEGIACRVANGRWELAD